MSKAQSLAMLIAQAWDDEGINNACDRHDYMVLCSVRSRRLAEWLLEHGVTVGGDDGA